MLVLLFLAAGSDMEQPDRQLLRTSTASASHAPSPPPSRQEVVKEKIILDLSLSNEVLEVCAPSLLGVGVSFSLRS